jgi:hypothetical protein
MRYSVSAYNIYDGDGSPLYDGDIVRVTLGGGNDGGKRYRSVRYHQLSISRTGRLKLSGIENIVNPKELVKTAPYDPIFQARGIDKYFKEYY